MESWSFVSFISTLILYIIESMNRRFVSRKKLRIINKPYSYNNLNFLSFEGSKEAKILLLPRPFNRSKGTFEATPSEPSLRSPMWLRFMQCFDTRIKAHTAGDIVLFEWYILFVSSSLSRTCLILFWSDVFVWMMRCWNKFSMTLFSFVVDYFS